MISSNNAGDDSGAGALRQTRNAKVRVNLAELGNSCRNTTKGRTDHTKAQA